MGLKSATGVKYRLLVAISGIQGAGEVSHDLT